MTQAEMLDKMFLHFYNNKAIVYLPNNLVADIQMPSENEAKGLADKLHKAGFIERTVYAPDKGYNARNNSYIINPDGIDFIDNIEEEEYRQKPFSYYLKLIEDKNIRNKSRQDLEDTHTQSVIDTNVSLKETNKSIKELNTKTDGYYENQKSLTLVIAGAAIASALFAGVAAYNGCNSNSREKNCTAKSKYLQDTIQQVQKTMKLLHNTLQTETMKDSLFLEQVKGVLKKKKTLP
jgi:hypothetical protein